MFITIKSSHSSCSARSPLNPVQSVLHVTSDGRGNGLKLQKENFGLDIRKNYITESIIKHWNRPVVEFASLEVFKKRIDVVLRDTN